MAENNGEFAAEAPGSPWSRTGDSYLVAVNDENQHAMWPAALPLPAGWRQQSRAMSRQACLDAVAGAWRDIVPASLGPAEPPGDTGGYVQHVFDTRADRRPGSIAITAAGPGAGGIGGTGGTARLTYRQLARTANQLAHRLRELGVGPDVPVGVSLERGADAVRCMLAVLKAGGAYLPLDPALPAARLSQMCAEAGLAIIVTSDGAADEALSDSGARLLAAVDPAATAGQPVTAPEAGLHAGNIAYVIYTSGSTGRPKGVAVSHGSLARQIQDVAREYQMSRRDRVVQVASLAFDTSIEQMLVTLLAGAMLLLPPPGPVAPTDLLRYLAEQRATVVDLTPAYWHQLLAIAGPDDDRLKNLRLMITGGEMARPEDCRAAARAASGARLINAYGLTETTITSALADVGRLGWYPDAGPGGMDGRVPAGRPLPHAQVLVLDEHLEPVVDGAAGEIYIGGAGVARGYLGQPARTAERFVPNPRGQEPGSRMYRTGDLGRWLGGELDVIGRIDRQLKVRGHRVEPAEVERALDGHPGIREAAVAAHEVSPGNTQLTAYYVRDLRSDDQLTGDSLRAFLAARVPGFMVPAEFVALHQIPRTPGGEVDRQALTYPVARPGTGSGATPYTPVQVGLSHLWSRILDVPLVGLDDDFFSLGGNSLLAAEMLAHAQVMFGIGPRDARTLTRCLLRDASLRGFSDAIAAARAGTLSAAAHEARVDFAHETALNHPVRLGNGPVPDWRHPRQVLLTGATGFFGAHLLSELLASTTADVHCLVRARDGAHALSRIARSAKRFAVEGLNLDRVVPVTGDLAERRLGLSAAEFRALARDTDVIYHAGALVNFIYPYAELRPANVTGTRELISLASLDRGIPVHYVSTTAVLAGFGAMGVREVTEDTPLAYADHLCIGYVESKFVSEELLRSAGRAGLPLAIYRPLDIVGDLRSGTWNTATEMCALIRFMTDTGRAPDIDLPLDFVPADVCAAAVRYISTHVPASGQTYHLSSPHYALLGSLVDRLRQHGFQIDAIPYAEWVGELVKHAARNPGHPMTPFVPLFVDHCPGSELTAAEMYLAHVFPAYTRTHLERALSDSGIAFPPVGDELLDRTIERLTAIGYLRDPAVHLSGGSAAGHLSGEGPRDAGQLLSRLGLVRDQVPRRGRARGFLRRSEPAKRAERLPTRHRAVPRGRRVRQGHQRVPV